MGIVAILTLLRLEHVKLLPDENRVLSSAAAAKFGRYRIINEVQIVACVGMYWQMT